MTDDAFREWAAEFIAANPIAAPILRVVADFPDPTWRNSKRAELMRALSSIDDLMGGQFAPGLPSDDGPFMDPESN